MNDNVQPAAPQPEGNPFSTPTGLAERLAWLGVLLLPVLVLFKRVPAELAVGVTVIAAVVIGLRRRDFSWLKQGWLYAAVALSVVLLLLSPFSFHPGNSALSAVLALRWPVFAAALLWLFLSRPTWLVHFERAVLIVVLFIVVDTVIQHFAGTDLFGLPRHGPTRLTGPFEHPLVGTFTDRVWFIALAAVWFSVVWRGVGVGLIALTAAAATGALFMFLTGERAALLTYLLATGVVYLGVFLTYPQWRKRLLAIGVLGMLLVVGLGASQKAMVGRSIDSTVETISHLDQTVYGLNFMTAFEQFKQHPLTGVGAREFSEYCGSQMPSYLARYEALGIQNGCVIHPHNFYTGMLAESGIGGFAAFLVMVGLLFWTPARDAYRAGRPMQAYLAVALLLPTFWPVQSTMEYFNGWTAAVIWLGVGWAMARSRLGGRGYPGGPARAG